LGNLLPSRTEHEVIDDELALAAEQVGERLLAARSVENIILFDFFPRQLAALLAQRVAGACKGLFFGEMRLARRNPLVSRYDLVRLHPVLLNLRKILFHLVERAVPAALMAVARFGVEELLVRERQQQTVTVGLDLDRDQ
jgi:hypothetical protein